MIPLRLSLKNFLCYREDVPTLDFSGIHLACLCGPNGHGKSALLDAVTWCLWGEARGSTQDDLISYGADECRVEMDFTARDTPYRVIRSRSRGGGRRRQGVTDLQLQVLGTGDPQPITGNQIRETQTKIDQILGMDYDTFVNSAFLLQGRADEFTNKRPGERKEVLAKILGLGAYDRLQARARDRFEKVRTSASEVDGALIQMQRQLEEITDPSEELTQLKGQLESVGQQLAERRRAMEEMARRVAELERQHSQLNESQQRMRSIEQEMNQLESSLNTGQDRLQQYRGLLQQAETIRQGVRRLEEARGQHDALEQARQSHEQLSQERAQLERTIDNARIRLEAQLEQLRVRVEVDLPQKTEAEAGLLKEQEAVRRQQKVLEEQAAAVVGHRDHQETLATRIGEAQSVAQRYKEEGQELGVKLELLQRTDGGREAVCPLCQTPLEEDGCGRLAATYQEEIESKRELYRQNASQLKQLEKEREDLGRDLPQREQSLAQAQQVAGIKLNELDRAIQESRVARDEVAQGKVQLTAARASLGSGDFAAGETVQLTDLDRRLASLGYNDETRQQSYATVLELQPLEEQSRRLSEAETGLPLEEESLAQSQEMLHRRRKELEELQHRFQADQEAAAALPQWQANLEQAKAEEDKLERQNQELIGRRGYLQGQADRLQALRREIAENSSRLRSLQEDQGIYQELVTAFGRQGMQAMIIETVVPSLEVEANSLLGRMTDNRMQLKLETQRQRRSGPGDPIETLEIQVNDELGPRSYEMYSGGEAFRINLALRIALSKVLSQRMGAPMPTLFIDEGFGTQDAAGRERILDVIAAVQNDFEKIIVVTHLDDLKEVFPVRIEVQKGDNGSTFWLS